MKYIIRAVIVLIILVVLRVTYNTRWIWRDYINSPPVEFTENEHISVALYPEGYHSATIFTNEGISAVSLPKSINMLRVLLMNLDVPGTIFVTPFHCGKDKLKKDDQQCHELAKLQAYGFEIAQSGCFDYSFAGNDEMIRPSREQELESIRLNRKILIELGFKIDGYRTTSLSIPEELPGILDELGYLYGSNFSVPPLTFRTFLFPGLRGSAFYPYNPAGLTILEIPSQSKQVLKSITARQEFEKVHKMGGVFVFRTEFSRLTEKENWEELKVFLKYIKKRETWLCTLGELSRWWLAREKVEITTRREGDIINIIYDNQTLVAMKSARFYFKNIPDQPKIYRVINRAGVVSAEGFIPETRWINVTLFPSR